MKRDEKRPLGHTFPLTAVVLLAASLANAQTIPKDAQSTCVVPPATFAAWFQTGAPSLNGVVNPANSVNFPNIPNCSFYQWSEQMFLWLTSPAPPSYGGDGRVFDSQVFYDVSAADPKGNRYFLPHVPGQPRFFNVRTSQAGPDGLPVIFDNAGKMFEIEAPQIAPSGQRLIRNSAGNLVELGRVTLGANKKPVFHDTADKVIQPHLPKEPAPTAEAKKQLTNPLTVQQFLIGRIPVFVDSSGNVLDVEEGQAGGGGALIAQNGSLIYYSTLVNDVYAYFLSGAKTNGITPAPTQFPTTAADLTQITNYAAKFGVTFPDPDALAIEVKSAWIEAAKLPDPSSYITMTATIPTFYETSLVNPRIKLNFHVHHFCC